MKPTILIKHQTEDHTPIALTCADMDEANFKYDVLRGETFTSAVEISLVDGEKKLINHDVIKPKQ